MVNWSPQSAIVRAFRSRAALALSARAAVEAGGSIADLRRDAWGHGLLPVGQAVMAAGAEAVLVDTPAEASLLAAEGVRGVVHETADIDPLLLYGLPDAGSRLRTAAVMRLAGRVLSLKPLRTGEAVSYGYTFRAASDTTLALVTGGYAQGIVRALGNRARVEIDGSMHRIVGRVAMDVCVVDVGDAPVREGAEVTYFGGRGPAADALSCWSTATGLQSAELVAVAGLRARREWEA
ncbi:alanine racemase [Microbacterium sp. NPDC055903]